MATKIQYERQTCGRCGGSGQYSYCQMYGSTCFGCNGTGKRLSRRGRAAQAIIRALRDGFCNRPIETIEPGQRVNINGRWRTITEVRRGDDAGFSYGESGPEPVTLVFRPAKVAGGFHVASYGAGVGTPVRVPTTDEQWAAMVAKARTLTGATVIESAAAAA